MKRILYMLLAITLCGLLCACGAVETAAETAAEPPAVDLDLTRMSSTVIFAQINRMMMVPDEFMGKVIRVSGELDVWQDPETGVVYTSCIVWDATACCPQGLEFLWAGHDYPDGFPEAGTAVTVTGRFETYMEGANMYARLADASLEWEP
ncbi:MAG: hypothetical protein K6E17_06435 [Clostridiales bacterium]|nr:hypothetical protein [Clostridiales bacterium]